METTGITLQPNDPSTRGDVFIRVSIFMNAWTTVMLWLTAPGSLTARLNEAGGMTADVIQAVMALCALGSLIDLVVNDLTPRWGARLPGLRSHRHIGYMALGATYMLSGAASVLTPLPGAWTLTATYIGIGTYCFAYVFHRIFARTAALKSAESAHGALNAI